MDQDNPIQPSIVTIFGAGGDLTWRKLIPALYNLYLDHQLPAHFDIVGLDLKKMSNPAFRQHLREGIDQFSRSGKAEDASWQPFAAMLQFASGDFAELETYERLAKLTHRPGEALGYARQPDLLPGRPALPGGNHRPHAGQGPARDRSPARAHRRGKALRPRSGVGPRTQPDVDPALRGKRRSTASTITWARRRSRTSWPSASPTRSSSRSGTGATSTTCRSPWPSRWASGGAAITTSTPGPCGTWFRITCCKSCA